MSALRECRSIHTVYAANLSKSLTCRSCSPNILTATVSDPRFQLEWSIAHTEDPHSDSRSYPDLKFYSPDCYGDEKCVDCKALCKELLPNYAYGVEMQTMANWSPK